MVSNSHILKFAAQFAASVGVKIRTVKAAHFFHAVALVIRKCVGVQVQCSGCLCVAKDAGKNFYMVRIGLSYPNRLCDSNSVNTLFV